MTRVLEYIGSFLLVLGPLVFIHELGHFLVAKGLGIRVKVFSLGFGPRLLGFRRGDTDYRVAAIPLGGYVRMAGDEADEHRTGARHEFLSRSRFERFLVFIAGAAFNVALALALTWVAFVAWGQVVYDAVPVVRYVAPDSPAERAGILPGDAIVSIAGRDASDVAVAIEEILMAPNTRKEVVFERAGERRAVTVDTGSEARHGTGDPGWRLVRSDEPVVVRAVLGGGAAERDGLQAGDTILGADGEVPIDEGHLRALIKASPEVPITFRVGREGSELDVTVTPALEDGEGRIGAALDTPPSRRELGAWSAAREAVRANVEQSTLVFRFLGSLVQGQLSMRAFSGPVEIAQISRVVVGDLESFVLFLAVLSLQLGVLNLLPIPVLDGGHIVILAVESVMRRELSEAVKERVMLAGLLFLLAFFGIILTLDVMKIGS